MIALFFVAFQKSFRFRFPGRLIQLVPFSHLFDNAVVNPWVTRFALGETVKNIFLHSFQDVTIEFVQFSSTDFSCGSP